MSEPTSRGVAGPDEEAKPQTGRQAAWNYLVFGLSKSSTLIMTVVLARLLTPADFGLFALALLMVNLFDWVKDLGVSAALVQSAKSWNRIAPTGLTLSVAFGVVAGGALAGSAGMAAKALGNPELTSLIQVLAIGILIASLSAIPAARLRRDLDFRRRIWPEFLGALAKATLAISLAVAGFGVWSLVYGQLLGTVVTTALYWVVARTVVRPGFDSREAGELVRFGIPVSGVALLAFAIYNIDYLAIGTQLGDTQLGLYTLAYRLPELIVLNLCVVISDVLFSSLSRLQGDGDALARHYLRAVTAVVALTAPLSVGLAAAAPAVMETLYGPEYVAAAGALAILSMYALVYSASFHSGDVYKAMGRPWILTATNAGKFVVLVGPIWWAARYGIVAVAMVLLAVELVHCVVRLCLVRAITRTRWTELLTAVLRPLPAAASMGVVMVLVTRAATPLPAPVTVVLTALAGLPTYALVLWLTAPDLVRAGVAAVRSMRKNQEAAPKAVTLADVTCSAEHRSGFASDPKGDSS